MNRPLMFNLTRLISRQHQNHATGVDRVDIHHAKLMLELSATNSIFFVSQVRNTLTLVPIDQASTLIEKLWRRWSAQKSQAVDTGRNTLTIHHPLTIRTREIFQRPLCRKLQKLLQKHLPPIYINSGHAGLQYITIHQYLKDMWHADIIVYLHDLIPIDYPEYSASPKELHQQLLTTIVNTATLVLTNSKHTQERFNHYCRQNAHIQPSTKVIHIGVEQHIIEAAHTPTEVQQPLQKQPYFIAIGTIEPRKNYALLLHIWREMSRNHTNQCPQLIIIGKRGWKTQNTIDLLEQCPSIQKYVTELNNASDNDLINYLKHAKALLFPSFEEGWGIPVTEALTLGTPVICSNIPVLREATQGLATYINPIDGIKWKETILSNSKTHKPSIAFQPNHWDHHTALLRTVIENNQ